MTDNTEHNDERRPAVPAGAYINRIARQTVTRHWWAPAVAVLIIGAGFVWDLRICIVGFALLLVIYPFAMLVSVLTGSMRPEIVARMYVAAFEVCPDGEVKATDDRGDDLKFCKIGDCATVDYGRDYLTLVGRGRKLDIFIVPRSLLSPSTFDNISANSRTNDAEL